MFCDFGQFLFGPGCSTNVLSILEYCILSAFFDCHIMIMMLYIIIERDYVFEILVSPNAQYHYQYHHCLTLTVLVLLLTLQFILQIACHALSL